MTTPDFKATWALWDKAWDLDIPTSRRLEILKQCAVPDFTYTNPQFELVGDLEALARYIDHALEATGNKLSVKHKEWFSQHNRSALHWDMDDITTSTAAMHGWSYGQYDVDGRLLCVADFW